MSLPRPLNWLRESDTSDDAEKVLIAAQGVKEALAEAQEKLSQMEKENTEQGQRLPEELAETIMSALTQSSGDVPRNQFIVSTWIPFLPPNAPEEILGLKFSAVPFPTPELAVGYANAIMEILMSLIQSASFEEYEGQVTAESVEDTPEDVIFHTEFHQQVLESDDEESGELIGAIHCKFWQYNSEAPRPGEDEEQGDWI